MNKGLEKAGGAAERLINIVGAVATSIAILVAFVATLTGNWDWRMAFFIALGVAVVCAGIAFYEYKSRMAIYMFSGVSKAERMCEADTYTAKRIAEARRSVWDFAWQDDKDSDPKTDLPAASRNTGSIALDDAIRGAITGGVIDYHEILTIRAYSGLLRKHLRYCYETPTGQPLKYRARIYDNTRRGYRKFPKIQFVVIDEVEVIFLSSGYEYCFAMRNKKTASVFLKYAHMAWAQADEWKKGTKDIVVGGVVVADIDQFLDTVEERIGLTDTPTD